MIWQRIINTELKIAIKDMLGPSLGIFAWSIVLNLAILKTGIALFRIISMSLMVYAGSAQISAIPLINGNFPIWIICFTALIINSRFIVYSAAIAPHFQHLPIWHRGILGFLNSDISFAVFSRKYPDVQEKVLFPKVYTYFIGTALTNWVVWQFGLFVAIFFGMQIPNEWNLSFAGTLVLICLITPTIQSAKEITIALVSIVICILTINLPFRLSILCSVLGAMGAAYLIDDWQENNV